MGLFKSKRDRQAELLITYTQAKYNYYRIDRYKQYTREGLTDELRQSYYNSAVTAENARKQLAKYGKELEDIMEQMDATAKMQAYQELKEKYGPIPEPDEDFMNKVREENLHEFTDMIACAVAYYMHEAGIRSARVKGNLNNIEKSKKYRDGALFMMLEIGESLHLHDNEIWKLAEDISNDLLDDHRTDMIQKLLDRFYELYEERCKRFKKEG